MTDNFTRDFTISSLAKNYYLFRNFEKRATETEYTQSFFGGLKETKKDISGKAHKDAWDSAKKVVERCKELGIKAEDHFSDVTNFLEYHNRS